MSDSSPKYDVNIQDSLGSVVGEHNTIYQYFKLSTHARLAQQHISFTSLIADKTEGFVGRQFVFDALDDYLQHNKSGYFIIEGEPGIGKTALIAQMVKTRGYPHHFNVAPQNIRSSHQFLANACAQIIARYDLPHEFLPDNAIEDSSFLVQCLEEASAKPENRPVILAVDAVDESERLGLPPRVNSLYLPPSLPEGAYIVVTSRPLDNLKLAVSNAQSLFLEADSENNLLDIRVYIQNFLLTNTKLRDSLSRWHITEAGFTEVMVKKSEGNFIYLHYILPAIAAGKFKRGTVDELPQGLLAYYSGHWQQMQIAEADEFDDLYAAVVCILAVVREPVGTEQLHKWTGKNRTKIKRAISQWREFLDTERSTEELRYRLYHTSFQDFLRGIVDLKEFHELIGRYYLESMGSQYTQKGG